MDCSLNQKMNRAVLVTPIPSEWEARDPEDPGFCYLYLFDKDYYREISFIIGPYPTWATLKTYGAAHAAGSYRLTRRHGYVHISTGGTGYSIRDLAIKDDEMVGGFPRRTAINHGALFRLFWIFLTVVVSPVYGRRRSSTDSVMARLLERHPTLDIPEDFPPMYQEYLREFDATLPSEYMCVESRTVRDYLLDLPWEDDEIMTLVTMICPNVKNDGLTFTQLDMFLARDTANDRDEPKGLSDRIHSVVSTLTDDTNDVLDTVPSVHRVSKKVLQKTSKLVGKTAESILDNLVDTTAVAATTTVDTSKNLADHAVNIVNKTAATLVEQTARTVDSVLDKLDGQATKARGAVEQGVDAIEDILWQTVSTATDQIRLHREFTSAVLNQTVALGSEIINPISDPAEAVRRFKSKQLSLDEYGDLLGSSFSTISNDVVAVAKTLYSGGGALFKGVYNNSYSGDEIAEKLMTPAKDLTESIVPTIKNTTKAVYHNWRNYLNESKDAFTTVVDGVPWASNRLGGAIGGFVNGLFIELGVKETPDWFGSLRTQMFGKPTERRERRSSSWSGPWRGNRTYGIINHIGYNMWQTVAALVVTTAIALFTTHVTMTRMGPRGGR